MVQWAMLQFLRSLIQSSEPAQRAWKKGEPHASSPHEANKEWAPHVVHWQKFIRAAHFREVFSPLPRRGQMGWLESAPFWQTYWTSFQRHCDNAAFAQEDELRQRMVHQVVVCASISGNMHFFHAAEKAGRMALATVLQCLCNYNQPLYHGAVLDWLSIQESKARRTVFARQQYLWSRLPWEKTMQECMFGVPGRHCDIDAFLDLVADGFTRWPLTPAEKTKALAHIFLSSPGALGHCPVERFGVALHGDQSPRAPRRHCGVPPAPNGRTRRARVVRASGPGPALSGMIQSGP